MQQPAYVPVILTSLKDIAMLFAVSQATIKDWASAGAPIIVNGNGSNRRYTTELADLYCWLKSRKSEGHAHL